MTQISRRVNRTDNILLILLSLLFLVLHVATSGQYGFHRDELATLDDARHLQWGFVAYPPITPLMGRLALSLFGISPIGIRLLPNIALTVAVLISGLMARELGGHRRAQSMQPFTSALARILERLSEIRLNNARFELEEIRQSGKSNRRPWNRKPESCGHKVNLRKPCHPDRST